MRPLPNTDVATVVLEEYKDESKSSCSRGTAAADNDVAVVVIAGHVGIARIADPVAVNHELVFVHTGFQIVGVGNLLGCYSQNGATHGAAVPVGSLTDIKAGQRA